LPLSAANLGTLAVIGPNANVARLGGYSGIPRHTVKRARGLRAKLGDRAKIVFARA